MTKAARKHKHPQKQIKPHKQIPPVPVKKQINKKFVVLTVVAILAVIPFVLGKYFEFNQPGPYDSAANVYSAKHILDGAKIGVEEKHSASTGTLLINMLGIWLYEVITNKSGFNEIGPKSMQMIMQAAALSLMFIAMRKLFGTLAAAVGLIVASVYLSSPLIAKFGNDKMQYAVACMVMGMSCFVLFQLTERRWYAILAGASLGWAPLFKQTGVSAIAAIGLFVIMQPLLKHRTWKQAGMDILLLLAGAVIAMGPLYIWIIGWDVQMGLPYAFVWNTLAKMLPAGRDEQAKGAVAYVVQSRKLASFSQQWPRVLRYYSLLILPIALAVGAIVARILRLLLSRTSTSKVEAKTYDRFVLLPAVWWLLDTVFVWISPRSYEQYYLALTASGAMVGGYLIGLYADRLKSSSYNIKWRVIGIIGLICMVVMSWHIFFGIEKSPHSGQRYGGKQRGYAQKLEEIANRKKGAKGYWEVVGQYIRNNSADSDKIYVWGWVPGIYIQAQRFSPAPKAFEGTMHTQSPQALSKRVDEILAAFEKHPPKFIVDTHKIHFPWDRPPLELWPKTPQGFLPLNKIVIDKYDESYAKMLHDNIDADEALRYKAMKPLRDYVMNNYEVAELSQYVRARNGRFVNRMFGENDIFKRK